MANPKPDIENIKKFKVYRYDKKLTYPEIEKLMGKSLKTLARWNRYILDGKVDLGELSTGIK